MLKTKNRIYIEGSNGGNYIEIIKINDNQINIQVGDCCVHTVDINLTAEVISNILTNIYLESSNNFLRFLEKHMQLEKKINLKFLKDCKDNFK
jgi:serine phosphatase RsbU (regulator of sigma subunit)